jgi:hypothetical protein
VVEATTQGQNYVMWMEVRVTLQRVTTSQQHHARAGSGENCKHNQRDMPVSELLITDCDNLKPLRYVRLG